MTASLTPIELVGLIWRESIDRRAHAVGMHPEHLRATVTTALTLIHEAHEAREDIGKFSDQQRRGPARLLQDQAYVAQICATVPVLVDLMTELVRLANLQSPTERKEETTDV
ncbi:MAG: hypothetical protein WDM77_06405 [Steroidobacteraceae bacterium]